MQEATLRIRVDVRHDSDTDLVGVDGEIDMATAPHLDEVLSDLTAPRLVIDLRRVDFIDSTGLHSLLELSSRFDGGIKVRLLVRRPGPVIRLLELVDVTSRFEIEEMAAD